MTNTQAAPATGYEQVTFEVRGTKHFMTYNGHEMTYLHSRATEHVPPITLEDALLVRGYAIPHGAKVLVTPKDDLSRKTLADAAQGRKEFTIDDRLYVLDV